MNLKKGEIAMSEKKMSFIKVPVTRRQFLKASTAASAGLMLSQGIWPKTSWSAQGNILKYRMTGEVRNFDTAFGGTDDDAILYQCIYAKLTVFKPGMKWGWQLEDAASIEEVSPTEVKFDLRPGIMFTGGFGELTSEDVKFSFERVADPKTKSPMAGDWARLDHVKTTGKYSGVIVLKDRFQPMWLTTLPYISGQILSKKAMTSIGGKMKGLPPCYSGPYVIKDWKPKQHIILVRNELWKGPQPDFDEIHMLFIDDDKTAERGFEAGDIDFTRISSSSLEKYKNNPPPKSTIKKYPSLFYTWLGMNMDHPKLKDIRVRKAIQMATDVPSILDAAYFGASQPATGIIPPGLPGYREKTIVPMEANIEGAKKLLAEAGHPDGISLTLDVLNQTTYVTAAQVIQATLAQAGIQVEIGIHETGAFWALGFESEGDSWKNLQLVLNSYSSLPEPYWYTAWFTKEQVGVWNWERFNNDEFNELHEKAVVEPDPDKRNKMYIRMQDLMEESGAYRFITNAAHPYMYRNSIIPAQAPGGLPLLRYFKKA